MQYGIATFALAGLFYVVEQFLKQKGDQNLAEVVQNNTKALEKLTTLLQVTMARQEARSTNCWRGRGGEGGMKGLKVEFSKLLVAWMLLNGTAWTWCS